METRNRWFVTTLLAAVSCGVWHQRAAALADDAVLRAPIQTQGTTPAPEKPTASGDTAGMGGLSAPGSDALMTPDLLLVNPNNPSPQGAKPLQAYIGMSVTMHVDRRDIAFDALHGIMITVTNEIDRPLVLDGDKAQGVASGKTFPCAPLTTLQQVILPSHTNKDVLESIYRNILPAAVTVGVVPTVKDFKKSQRPVLERYGPDEERREVEQSRFGKRILWPHQKTQGIVYFETDDTMDGVKVQIPATTLFDTKDTGMLVSSPQ